MASHQELRERSAALFRKLLDPTAGPELESLGGGAAAVGEGAARPFSHFDAEDGPAAVAFAAGLAITAQGADDPEAGLGAALDLVESAADQQDPELVRQGFAIFVTHDRLGRRLLKPRTAFAAAERFAPSRPAGSPPFDFESFGGAADLGSGSTGQEALLDSWREDALANEHHEHWHQVYPWPGVMRPWAEVTASTPPAVVQSILDKWQASGGDSRQFSDSLDGEEYRALLRQNDRHGELFVYMHQQMLARYDAERLSVGLEPVAAMDDLDQPIAEGYDPGTVLGERGFGVRPADAELPAFLAERLKGWREAIQAAIDRGVLETPAGEIDIDRESLGEVIEAAASAFREPVDDRYGNLHNTGHGVISSLSAGATGVMASTTVAIRDPVFWRWHRAIDDLSFRWQDTRGAEDFSDAPPVRLRNDLDGSGLPWLSPDLAICRTTAIPGHEAEDFLSAGGQAVGELFLGGEAWEFDATSGVFSLPDGRELTTTDRLTTEIRRRTLELDPDPGTGEPRQVEVEYLTHEPFCWFLRVENPTAADLEVSVRLFLAPSASADSRRSWIEMDKFVQTLPAHQKTVIFRADELSSVVKKPADRDPAVEPPPGDSHAEDDVICDCGWPYTLLLPRGIAGGMDYRLLAVLTDARLDRVVAEGHCGATSFCGAVDRYPDSRDMGYPLARPLAATIEDTVLGEPHMIGRSLVIDHLGLEEDPT